MLYRTRLLLLVFGPLCVGCAKTPGTSLAANDTVYPIVSCPKTWHAGKPVVMTVKLGRKGADTIKPRMMHKEDVPLDPDLRATFVFCRGNDVLKTYTDVKLVPDC